MHKYHCNGFQPVNADRASEAAGIFAVREARRDYRGAGVVCGPRLESWTESGSQTFQVGVSTGRFRCGSTPFRNITVTVRRAD